MRLLCVGTALLLLLQQQAAAQVTIPYLQCESCQQRLIECPPRFVLTEIDAFYGRVDPDICPGECAWMRRGRGRRGGREREREREREKKKRKETRFRWEEES